MNEVRVSSWNELLECLYEDAWMSNIQRFRSPYAFRGLPDASFSLMTSLMQLGGDFPQLEGHLLRNFKKYAHRDVVEQDSIWHWLSLAQHHGLPTRLLDWTFSPFVALHFATATIECLAIDGAVWTVDYKKAHDQLPYLLKAHLAEEGADVFTVEMLQGIRTLHEFDNLAPDTFIAFFEPPSLDDRIINQYAMFSVISDPRVAVTEWLEQHPDTYRKIIIPAAIKWEIRDKLDQANINERVLFPGLDGLSLWLKRQYYPVEQKKIPPTS
ncbi:FRG domain-containing protein [Nibrella saemangeumensis]|uniref:FRG domain-containing protein n=1 Tax=Nibrella saemangeumensis TaxID=1084526 RepID=A0ABP8MIF7_9BACT